jgi:hypothetical protein
MLLLALLPTRYEDDYYVVKAGGCSMNQCSRIISAALVFGVHHLRSSFFCSAKQNRMAAAMMLVFTPKDIA